MLTRLRPWIGFAAGAALLALAAAGEAADKIKFNMSWLPQGSVGGILVGIDKGFYREVGIEVQAVRGFGGLRTVNEIDQGQFEFGYGNPVGVVLNRAKGGNTRMIGTINSRWPAGLYVTSASAEVAGKVCPDVVSPPSCTPRILR